MCSSDLFEIKFVKHQEPFYQLGKLYTYKLDVELFQYSSEKIDTGIPEVDVFENLKSFDVTVNPNDTTTLTLGLTLATTDVVTVYGSSATLSFNAYGSEIA